MAEESDTGEKTEDPSEHKIEQFRNRGEVAASKEFNSVLILSGVLLTLMLSGVYVYEVISEYFEWLLQLDPRKVFQGPKMIELGKKTIWTGLKCVAPVFFASACLGVVSQVSQVGIIFAGEALKLNLDRVNPINGMKRLFSKKSIAEVIKGLFKFSVIIWITYAVIQSNLLAFGGLLHAELPQTISFSKEILVNLSMYILLGLFVIACMDFAWEKYSYKQKLMMTKQEAKEESKQKEGNPQIKQRIRTIQREMSRKRMMQDVPQADVIVTNPTHISIAIKYNPQEMIAPQIIAKGSDNIAFKIREIAKDHEVPIVENVPLARALYKTVKVGEGVPRSLYKAVAEILAFVYRLKKKKKALG